MASPPFAYSPTAISPPYPSHSQLPALSTANMNKKRSADAAAGSSPSPGAGPALKRRKASAMSISSAAAMHHHPLRQTSFPPDDSFAGAALHARSPSVDFDNMSLVSGSQVSASVAAAPAASGGPASARRKRVRRTKADKTRDMTPSVAPGGGSAAGGGGGARGGGGRGGGGNRSATGAARDAGHGESGAQDDDEDEDEDDETMAATAGAADEKSKGLLLGAMLADYPEQQMRASGYNYMFFNKGAVRRLVNSTISQSVAESCILSVRGVTKVYANEIIVLAREVQAEWALAGEKQTDLPSPPAMPALDGVVGAGVNGSSHAAATAAAAAAADPSRPPPSAPDPGLPSPAPSDPNTPVMYDSACAPVAEEVWAPLRPEHLQEAVRRWKKQFEQGGAGAAGMWVQQQQSGAERFPTRTGGRRIFR